MSKLKIAISLLVLVLFSLVVWVGGQLRYNSALERQDQSFEKLRNSFNSLDDRLENEWKEIAPELGILNAQLRGHGGGSVWRVGGNKRTGWHWRFRHDDDQGNETFEDIVFAVTTEFDFDRRSVLGEKKHDVKINCLDNEPNLKLAEHMKREYFSDTHSRVEIVKFKDGDDPFSVFEKF